MTYSNTAIQNPSLSALTPAQTHAAYIAAVSPRIQAFMMKLLFWLITSLPKAARHNRSARVVFNGKAAAAVTCLAFMMVCLPGKLAQKRAFLNSIFDKINARLDRLYAKYLIWRQRKCWMWSGGLMNTRLARLPGKCVGANDEISFDALIPD